MAGNSGGPWGGGGQGGDDRGPKKNEGGGRRPANDGLQIPPEIDDMLKKGQDQLRVLMGGKGTAAAAAMVIRAMAPIWAVPS